MPEYFSLLSSRLSSSHLNLARRNNFKNGAEVVEQQTPERKKLTRRSLDDISFEGIRGKLQKFNQAAGLTPSLTGNKVQITKMTLDMVSDKNCPRCVQPVETEGIFALGRLWHLRHFNCGVCRYSMVGKRYFIKERKVLCFECFDKTKQELKVRNRKVDIIHIGVHDFKITNEYFFRLVTSNSATEVSLTLKLPHLSLAPFL